ncbi:hypothetical protein [Neorhizobium sp. DT-125]|uniref:hypothetical protein n=1 Tax=Neorhizobium sp. DT-125 TaxID=3396163 RepID=UPI003F1D0D41
MFEYLRPVHYAVENLDAIVEYLEMAFDIRPTGSRSARATIPLARLYVMRGLSRSA